MAVLEQLLKAALLAYIYFNLALALYGKLLEFSLLALFLTSIAKFSNSKININFLNIEMELFGLSLKFTTEFQWKYDKFLNLDIPFMISEIYINDELLVQDVTGIITEEIFNEFNQLEFSPHLVNASFALIDETIQKYKFSVIYWDNDGFAPKSGFPELKIWKNGEIYAYEVMTPSTNEELNSTSYQNGVLYESEVELLEEGQYTYMVSVVSENNIYNSTGELLGPFIEEEIKPSLQQYRIQPEVGFAYDTTFNFTVIYKDPHGNPPKDNQLILRIYEESEDDNKYKKFKEYIMIPKESTNLNYSKGVIFYNNSIWFDKYGKYYYYISGIDPLTGKPFDSGKREGPYILPPFYEIGQGIAKGFNYIFSTATITFSAITLAAKSNKDNLAIIGIIFMFAALGSIGTYEYFSDDPDSAWALAFSIIACCNVFFYLRKLIEQGVYKKNLDEITIKSIEILLKIMATVLALILGKIGKLIAKEFSERSVPLIEMISEILGSLISFFIFRNLAEKFVAGVFGGKIPVEGSKKGGSKPKVSNLIKNIFRGAMYSFLIVGIVYFILGIYKSIKVYFFE